MNTNFQAPKTPALFESLSWSEAEEHGYFEENALSLDDVLDSNHQQEDDHNPESVHEHPDRL